MILRPASTSHLKQAFPRGGGGLSPRLLRGRSRSCPVLDLPPTPTNSPTGPRCPSPTPLPEPARRRPGQPACMAGPGRAGGPALTHRGGVGRPGTREGLGALRVGAGGERDGGGGRGAGAGRVPGERPERCGRGTLGCERRGGAGGRWEERSGSPAYGAGPCAPPPAPLLPAPRWAEPAPGGAGHQPGGCGSPSPSL